jgi:hypothetical protein
MHGKPNANASVHAGAENRPMFTFNLLGSIVNAQSLISTDICWFTVKLLPF